MFFSQLKPINKCIILLLCHKLVSRNIQFTFLHVCVHSIEMFAHTLHLFVAHATDDLPLQSYNKPSPGSVCVGDATLVSRHDTAGRCNVSHSLASLYVISCLVLAMNSVHKDLHKSLENSPNVH